MFGVTRGKQFIRKSLAYFGKACLGFVSELAISGVLSLTGGRASTTNLGLSGSGALSAILAAQIL